VAASLPKDEHTSASGFPCRPRHATAAPPRHRAARSGLAREQPRKVRENEVRSGHPGAGAEPAGADGPALAPPPLEEDDAVEAPPPVHLLRNSASKHRLYGVLRKEGGEGAAGDGVGGRGTAYCEAGHFPLLDVEM
jgi:hypothetical protein